LIGFSELFATNFNPQFFQGIEVDLKLFLIYPWERLGDPFEIRVFTHYSGGWVPFENRVATNWS